MADKQDKRYCIVDHADKLGERKARNPNRLQRTRGRHGRWIESDPGERKTADKDHD
jgi:hypothetical protein